MFVWAIVGTKSLHLCLLVLFNKLRLFFTKLLFVSHKHASLYVIILDSHVLWTTSTYSIELTVHIANLAHHLPWNNELISNTCQLKLQSGVTSLFITNISYNINVKSVCVCVSMSLKKFYWYIYDALADTMSLKCFGFWRILSQDSYDEHMPKEIITG